MPSFLRQIIIINFLTLFFNMNPSKEKHFVLDLQEEENLPLDKVLKPRQPGKKLPEDFSSQSQKDLQKDMVKKSKLIMKDQKDHKSKDVSQNKEQKNPVISSTEIAKQLILDESLTIKEAEQLMIKLKNIKSLKYDKLSQRIRENLVQVRFKKSFYTCTKVFQAYSKEVNSTHLLHSIFHGYQLAWRCEKFENIEIFQDFLNVYFEKVPNCLNKRFVKWIKERLMVSKNGQIYTNLRKKVLQIVNRVINQNKRQKSGQNEKIIGLVVYFELWDSIDMQQLVKIVPLQKINEYTDNDQYLKAKFQINDINQNKKKIHNQKQKNNNIPQQRKMSSSSNQNEKIPQNRLPPLIHHSILELIKKNDLKEVEKIIKSYKISHLLYPQFVQKLEMKYLQYAQRTNPIYVLDELVHNKINLVQGLIDIYLRKRKYDHVEHFMNKYKLRGIQKPDPSKIFVSPLKHQDSFGPTQSHVLNQRPETFFLRLLDFQVLKSNVIWIDSLTIFQKPYTNHLKKLLFAKQIGLDSESTSGIHVFEKSRLQLIQVYEPESNIIFLFDVRDFKNDKKKRNRKNNAKTNEQKQSKSQKIENIKPQQDQIKQQSFTGKSFTEPIDLEEEKNLNIQKNIKKQQSIESESKIENLQDQNKAWYRFTKIIENVFKNSTIYGHVLHSDLGDIINELNLKIKANNLKIKDSQLEFKKYYPQQTKSKLSFLAQKCFGKEISKFQQCGAWDKRPLRNAQKHYAALDALLPYKLVKWMEDKFNSSTAK